MQSALKIRAYPLILLIAFALNAVLPFFAVYNSSADHARLASVFGEKILLCTGDGFKWVKLADLQSGKEKPQPHSQDKCPLCYAARHGLKAVTLPTVTAAANYGRIHAPVAVAYESPTVSFHTTSSLRVRAPPVFFIG